MSDTARCQTPPLADGTTAPGPGRFKAVLDDDTLSGIIRLLMRIDANVQQLLDVLTDEEDGDDEEPDT